MLFSLFAVLSAFAEQISEQEALAIAQQFVQDRQQRKTMSIGQVEMDVGTSFKNFYIFNVMGDNGFVIVSGNNRTQKILGFSERGKLDGENLPCNVKWLLQYFERVIPMIGNSPQVASESQTTKADIATLIDTQWGQGEPYNSLCPQIDGQKCITGCVATAMAQVINYNRWPQKQTAAIPSYTSASNGILMPGVPQTQFDWNNMTNTSIAQLMLYCGQAVHMDYGVGASGAFSGDVPGALVETFGYSKSANLLSRDGYSDEQWGELVYEELRQGGPVLYFGQSPTAGGHAFIVDGYADGMFHLNWGWDGYCDGYFALENLTPTADEGFNNSQEMIVDVCPPAGTGDISRPKAVVTAMTCSERYLERDDAGSDFPAFSVGNTMESDLAEEATLQVGLALYNDNGLVKVLSEETHDFTPTDSYTAETQVTIGAGLPQGDYRIVAINRINDSDDWLTNAGSTTNYVAVTIGETSMQLQPMPKNSDDEYYIDFGIHTIDNITYQLYSEYENLRAKVVLLEEKDKYSGDLYIPDNVTYQNMTFKIYTFDGDVFNNSPNLTSLSIPVMDQWNRIFDCPQLAHVELREAVLACGRISGCNALESITYPSSCSYIDSPTLCSNMKSIKFTNKQSIQIIPAGDVVWGKEDMPALADVYFAGDIPPTLYNYGAEVSNMANDNVTIHIPQGTLETYKRSVWKDWNLVEDQPAIPVAVKWDYCGNDENAKCGIVVGNGKNDVEFAMRMPKEMLSSYKDCEISRIEFYTPTPALNDYHYEDVEYVFITTSNEDYVVKKTVATIRGTWMSVELDHPYPITGEDLFVGIGRDGALGANWANLDIVEDGLWVRVMGDDLGGMPPGEWEQNAGISDWNHPLPIRAVIEGENLPTDVLIGNVEIVDGEEQQSYAKAGELGNEERLSSKQSNAASMSSEGDRYFCLTTDANGKRAFVAKQQKAQKTLTGNKLTNGGKQLRVKLRNRTPRIVKQVVLDWDIDGERKGQHTMETAMLTNHEDIAYIDIPNDVAGRNHTVTVSVSSIDGEPDAISANSCKEQNYSVASSTFFPRKIVMEEATGTWCGYCPSGIATIEKMNERYPDNFIAIAIHDDDMVPAFDSYQPFRDMVTNYPSAYINRSYWANLVPFDIEDMKDKGEAQITATAYSPDGTEVQVSTETTFGFNDNGSTEYRIAYVLTEDNVGPYYQANYYSNPSAEHNPEDYLDWWVHQESLVETTFNEVARAIYDDYYGVGNTFPKNISEGEKYSNKYTFSLPENVQNMANLKVVTLLIDGRTGEILNADRTALVFDASGIHQLEADGKLFDVYNASGMKVRHQVATLKGLPEGVYIVNGVKYIIKR